MILLREAHWEGDKEGAERAGDIVSERAREWVSS